MADAFEARMQGVIEKVESGQLPPDAARVVVSNLQWRAAKAAPKAFGDAVNLKHSDPDGGPVQHESTVTHKILSLMTTEQLTAIEAGETTDGSNP